VVDISVSCLGMMVVDIYVSSVGITVVSLYTCGELVYECFLCVYRVL